MIEDFWNELNEGEIHARDSLQFELKSEFFINPHLKQNVYKQEVYLFIPNSLQINSETYSKQQFYLDQTNLIRYKTPLMTLSELVNFDYSPSPLTRLHHLLNQSNSNLFTSVASDELKLFAAIFRAAIRERVYKIIKSMNSPQAAEQKSQAIGSLCAEITEVCQTFRQLKETANARSDYPQLIRHFKYIDEFISTNLNEFLMILLQHSRSLEKHDRHTDELLAQLITQEQLYRKKKNLNPKTPQRLFADEAILYRQALLHRFVLESLMLRNKRFSSEEKHRNVLGALAAGIAMLVYMTLLAWNSSSYVINSFPFVALAAFLYIIKDRIKEGFKTFYSKQAPRWFPDYSTEIISFKGFKIGKLTEKFAFIDTKQLPHGFLKIRNHDFHEELQALYRHETIMQYKREITLNAPRNYGERRREVTTIFRFNIHRFLQKASNAFQTYLMLDPETQQISEKLLPKVYHLNLIIRHSFLQEDLTPKIEIKTYRVVVDKNGIKRVEHIKDGL
jgi:hypothetical protein